jgi:hypothetical protein
MATAGNWRDVRPDALEAGLIAEEDVTQARRRHADQIRARRLRVVRRRLLRLPPTRLTQAVSLTRRTRSRRWRTSVRSRLPAWPEGPSC